MSLSQLPPQNEKQSFPRVSGDEPVFEVLPRTADVFSPSERG